MLPQIKAAATAAAERENCREPQAGVRLKANVIWSSRRARHAARQPERKEAHAVSYSVLSGGIATVTFHFRFKIIPPFFRLVHAAAHFYVGRRI